MAINLSGININGGSGGATVGSKLRIIPVEALPDVEKANKNALYIVKSKKTTAENKFDEYIVVETADGRVWELFGRDVTIDLTPYALKTEVDKKQDKLVNQQNIRSINNVSLIGDGNVSLEVFADAAEHKAVTDFIANAPDVYATIEQVGELEATDAELNRHIDSVVDAFNGDISAVRQVLNILIGSDSSKSVRTIAAEELAKQLIPESASESLDTLKKIALWIQQHPNDVAAINAAIAANREAIETETSRATGVEDELKTSIGHIETFNQKATETFAQINAKILTLTGLSGTDYIGIHDTAEDLYAALPDGQRSAWGLVGSDASALRMFSTNDGGQTWKEWEQTYNFTDFSDVKASLAGMSLSQPMSEDEWNVLTSEGTSTIELNPNTIYMVYE